MANTDKTIRLSTVNKQIIFVDSAVQDYQNLLIGADANAKIVILDNNRSAIEQISATLSDNSCIEAVHILSHGTPGSIQLGNTELNLENLHTHSPQLLQWGKALTEKAVILLYGCSVAAGISGIAFIDRLSSLVGALVAANDKPTGNTALGGDWQLKIATGEIQTPLALAAEAMAAYPWILGPQLFKDIYPGGNSYPYNLTVVNNTLYFTAEDGTNGFELWKSDGTATGTVLVKDINPGIGDSFPDFFTNINGTLYFNAQTSSNGAELWKSDGTATGTVLVKDINPGNVDSYPEKLTNVNGILYFRSSNGTNGFELWKSDGTAAGTVLVKDINPGIGDSFPDFFTNINGTLYFNASDGINGAELWKSDGTAAGTAIVKDIYAGGSDSYPNPGNVTLHPEKSNLTNINGTLYFQADDGTNGFELWKSDGTAAGTVLVKDINPGGTSSPDFFTNINDTLYFNAKDSTNGAELWKSDGTTAGTVLVKDINPGNVDSYPEKLININGTLYFRASDGINGNELWKSDGTAAGTVLVKDINPGGDSYPDNFTNFNGSLYFTAYDGTTGGELWKSDGTEAGTFLVKDINPGGNSYPYNLTNFNGNLYFNADDGTNGYELWQLAPTTITAVTATTADRTYAIGEVIPITIQFSDRVDVAGTPKLTLATGGAGTAADYISGSGTNTLTFNYTVAAGNASADLDYLSTTALSLNSGTIKDAATQDDAILALPAPAATNSLGANKALVIDGIAPTVANITSTLADGSYTVGAVIPITIQFSDRVNVTGTPKLTLATGGAGTAADYISGSGTNTLTFNYTVAAGNASVDLDYLSTTALSLDGGTIKDAVGNDATLTLPAIGATNSLGDNKAIVIDGIAPTVSSITSTLADGSYTVGQVIAIAVQFNENVNVTGTPQLTLNTGAIVNYASGSGTNTLIFNYTVAPGETAADLDYSATSAIALNGGTIKDAIGNDATLTLPAIGATNSLGANKAIVIDTTAPTVTLNQNTTQADPTGSVPVNFAVVFSEAVTGFDRSDIILGGTAGATTATVTGTGTDYNVAVTGMTGNGTVTADIKPNAVTDKAGNANVASTSTDNLVNYTIPAPEIQVLNGAIDIIDGTTTALDFGSVVLGTVVKKTFTINNTGTGALNLSNFTLPDGFSIVGDRPTTIAAGASGSLQVQLDAATVGNYNGILQFTNNDSNENPFDFAISGAVIATPTPTPEPTPMVSEKGCLCDRFPTPDLGTLKLIPNKIAETLQGSEGDDRAIGNATAEAFNLKGGNDRVAGEGGNDNIYGGAAADLLFGNSGNDYIDGGAQNDIIFAGKDNDAVNGGADNDTVLGDIGNDTLFGGDGNDWLFGNTGTDTIDGEGGNDVIFGGQGNDALLGNIGNDIVVGDIGDDLVKGSDGNDWLFGNKGADFIAGGAGEDTLFAGQDDDLAKGGEGNDIVVGDKGNDSVCGGEGNDQLYGNAGADSMDGCEGDDLLYGGKDNDTLIGNQGNDALFGEMGNDSLIGGTGSDTFILTKGSGSDAIADFENGIDLILLAGGLTFEQLSVTSSNGGTSIGIASSGELLAQLNNVSSNLIGVEDFALI